MLTIAEWWTAFESYANNCAGDAGSALPPGASTEAIASAEATLGVALPEDFRQFLLHHNGSGPYFFTPYQLGGACQNFMPLDDILRIWKGMMEVRVEFDRDGEFGEQKGPIKRRYWNARWIPFAENGGGDNIVIDLDPRPEGTSGQIVDWWHEGGVSTFLAPSLRAFLNDLHDRLKSGEYQVGRLNSDSA
jgi:cell wall assembly regulator SMI1